MEMLTPDEFFARVGVRVPESVIRNLLSKRDRSEWWFVGPYIPLTDEIIADMCIPEGRQLDLLEGGEGAD